MMQSTYSLQQSDLFAKVSQRRHKNSVIDGNENNDADGVEEGQRCCRNLNPATKHLAVHLRALLHKEATHLHPTVTVSLIQMTTVGVLG